MLENEIFNCDSLEFLKKFPDYHFDLNFSDPPYGLGSEIIIDSNGKPNYSKLSDITNDWKMPDGEYWEEWFKESFRISKYGGRVIMFGMDRQLLLFKYYAKLAGFSEQQSLYWYFISNFPKSSNLSANIDKNAGIKKDRIQIRDFTNNNISYGEYKGFVDSRFENNNIPITDLAKKYAGYKYSISPLKQTNETIMVFQKPYKYDSCLHDTIKYEDGDKECSCGALNINNGRVPTDDKLNQKLTINKGTDILKFSKSKFRGSINDDYLYGRYPSQTFVDLDCANILDSQAESKSDNEMDKIFKKDSNTNFNGKGECSKILHTCRYETGEMDLYIFDSKVNKRERNDGCENIEQLDDSNTSHKNIHPTLKPISLNHKILELFKTPNNQTVIYPFAGAGSEIIGGIEVGFDKWYACEINSKYIEIANERIKHWDYKNEIKQKKISIIVNTDKALSEWM